LKEVVFCGKFAIVNKRQISHVGKTKMAKIRQSIPKDTKTYVPLEVRQDSQSTQNSTKTANMGQITQDMTTILVKLSEIEKKLDMVLGTKIQRPLTIPSKYRRHEEICLGFRISDKDTISGGKRYRKWYASRQWQGKRVWVYLGSSKDGAEEKIREYCAKHGISLPE
jgi:hypothetical protein